jgi:hypothetical protein
MRIAAKAIKRGNDDMETFSMSLECGEATAMERKSQGYFPIQNLENIESKRSSVVI